VTPDEGHAPATDRTLSLPTVATTAASDELGQEVERLVAAYHGYPVSSPALPKITRSSSAPALVTPGTPSTSPATADGERASITPADRPVPPSFSREHGPVTPDPLAPALVPGGSRGRGERVTFSSEIRQHPYRLAGILAASVPVGVLIAQLLGASPLYHPGYAQQPSTPATSDTPPTTPAPRDPTSPFNRVVPHVSPPRHRVAPVQPAPKTSHAPSRTPSRAPSHSSHPHPHPSPSHSADPDPTPTASHSHHTPPPHTDPPPSETATESAPVSTGTTPTESHPEVSPS
jgi:hypothetical protein